MLRLFCPAFYIIIMNYYYNVLLSLLAWRLALFRLALQGYLDALLPRASHLAQFACIPSLMLTSTINMLMILRSQKFL